MPGRKPRPLGTLAGRFNSPLGVPAVRVIGPKRAWMANGRSFAGLRSLA